MKIGSMIIKIKLLIVLFAVLMSNQVLAKDIDINDMTLKEAIEYSQSGNPIEAVLDYCKENNLYGANTFTEQFGDGEWGNVKLGSTDRINRIIEGGVEGLEEKHKSIFGIYYFNCSYCGFNIINYKEETNACYFV